VARQLPWLYAPVLSAFPVQVIILSKLKLQNYEERYEIHMHMHISTRTFIHIDMYICIQIYT
jgi:hypothetical protein